MLAIAVVLLVTTSVADARPATRQERRDLGKMMLVLGGLASAAGTALAFAWNQQVWQNFGCEVGSGLGGGDGSECGTVDPGLVPTATSLVVAGQLAVVSGSLLIRF
jgi:hypothetical protein